MSGALVPWLAEMTLCDAIPLEYSLKDGIFRFKSRRLRSVMPNVYAKTSQETIDEHMQDNGAIDLDKELHSVDVDLDDIG